MTRPDKGSTPSPLQHSAPERPDIRSESPDMANFYEATTGLATVRDLSSDPTRDGASERRWAFA